DDLDALTLRLPEPHDRALAVGALDLAQRRLQRAVALGAHGLTLLLRGVPGRLRSAPAVDFYDGIGGDAARGGAHCGTPTRTHDRNVCCFGHLLRRGGAAAGGAIRARPGGRTFVL